MGILFILLILFTIFIVFGVIDLYFYCKAKYPERTINPLYKYPGGGIFVFLKFRKKE